MYAIDICLKIILIVEFLKLLIYNFLLFRRLFCDMLTLEFSFNWIFRVKIILLHLIRWTLLFILFPGVSMNSLLILILENLFILICGVIINFHLQIFFIFFFFFFIAVIKYIISIFLGFSKCWCKNVNIIMRFLYELITLRVLFLNNCITFLLF